MKVCTDACLFGSLIAQYMSSRNVAVKHALDIGAGTGLLSLMCAQKHPDAHIEAVEIEESAAMQATQNVAASPWHKRIQVLHGDIKKIALPQNGYELIFSNPPFFENDLKSPDNKRNLALHSHQLSLGSLFEIAVKNLATGGIFAILLPHHRTAEAELLCQQKQLFVLNKIEVFQTPKHRAFRSILFMSPTMQTHKECSSITIRDESGKYTPEFQQLLEDYYLACS